MTYHDNGMLSARRYFQGRWLVFLSTLALLLVQAATAFGQPAPPVEVRFNVASAASAAETVVRVTEKRSYHFDLNVYYAGQDDLPNARRLAGGGARLPDGRYSEPGVPVVVHVVVTEEGRQGPGSVRYEKTTTTQGHYTHGFLNSGGGYFARTIGAVVLTPGIYRIRANAMDGASELGSAETRLSVTFDARLAPIKD